MKTSQMLGQMITVFILLVGLAANQCDAQKSLSAVTQEKLGKPIHITASFTTAGLVIDDLSKQIGLRIDLAPELKDRTLIVALNSLTARSALDALCECNDWRWSESAEQQILIDRSLPHNPRTVSEINKSIVAALPKDFRTFLAIGRQMDPINEFNQPGPRDPARNSIPGYQGAFVRQRLYSLANHCSETLLPLLNPAPKQGLYYPYMTMTPEAKQKVLTYAVLFTLAKAGKNVLYNDFTPFQLDPTKAVIELKNGMFQVGAYTETGGNVRYDFFAAPVNLGGKSP